MSTQMKKAISTTSALFAACLFTASVSAASISYNTSVWLSGGSGFSSEDTGFWWATDTVSLDDILQFDPLNGELTSATITINGNLSYSVEVWGDTVIDVTAFHSIEAESSVVVGAGIDIDGTRTLRPYDALPDTVYCAGGPYDDACADMISGGGAITTSGIFTGSELTAFMGNGFLSDIDINLLAGLDTFTFDNINNPDVFIEADFTGDITINYEYSEVPVPAAVWLFGSGLLTLFGFMKRKSAV